MAELRRRRSVSQTQLHDLLIAQLAGWQQRRALAGTPVESCEVIDVGGGTGGVALALAALGHRVTVVDPSPDALASLARRTAEAGLTGVRGVLGDAADLAGIVGPDGADVAICHRVLEVVDDPAAALTAVAGVLRSGGALSLVVAQRAAMVLSQALAGHIAQARRTLADPTRFDTDRVLTLLRQSGFEIQASAGIGAVADHVPEALLESEPGAYAELVALEQEISEHPAFRAVAPLLHVFAATPD